MSKRAYYGNYWDEKYPMYHGWRADSTPDPINEPNVHKYKWCGHPLYESKTKGLHCKCGDTQINKREPYSYHHVVGYYDDGPKNPRKIKRRGSPPKPPAPKQTKLYKKMDKRSDHWGESNDCTVKATAIVCGVTYEEAHAALALRGRNYRKGVTPGKYHAAIKSFGFKLERLIHVKDYNFDEKSKGKKTHPLSMVKTVGKIKDALPSRGVFLIGTSRHVFAARAGEMHDWTRSTRRQPITSVYRIIRVKQGDE